MRNTDGKHSKEEVLLILDKFSQKLVDSGYDLGTREDILKSGLRKGYRELAQARREGASRYRTRQQMNESKEVKSILNKPWFWRMRGGAQTKLVKEGETKDTARNKVRNVEISRERRIAKVKSKRWNVWSLSHQHLGQS